MSLSRKLLESMGLDADKVTTIIEAHAETVDSLKSQISQYKADAEKLDSITQELTDAKKELEGLKASDWQTKYEALNSEYESFKTAQADKELKLSKETAYKKLLLDTGVSDKRVDSILKLTDLKDLELENGVFKNADELTESIKTEWGDFITTTNVGGANTSVPPVNDGTPKFTREQIARMSASEINANWESIKDSMKG